MVKSEIADDDGTSDNMLEPIKVDVHEETEDEDNECISVSEFYPDHVVKDEMVIGPERLQPADITYTLQEEYPPAMVKSEIADDDGTSDNMLEPIKVDVHEETEDEDNECISVSELYPDHVVKDEMVIGPERLQPADITYTLQEEYPPAMVKSEIADDDGTSDNMLEPIKVDIHEETEDEDNECISVSELYPDHVVKDEMVIGPERLQPADITYTLQEEYPPAMVKSEIADDDGTSDNMLEPIKVDVHEETEDEDNECISVSEFYPDHVVKDEMVIGPERLQPADITYTLQEEYPPAMVKSEIADDDGTSDNMLEPIKVDVHEETEDEDNECISVSELYPDHVVKDEMVIGPERLQPADITYTLQEEYPPAMVKSEIADDDGTSDNMLEPIKVDVHEETEDEDNECISVSEFYPDHVVKDEMVILVIGPERLQPADITYTLQEATGADGLETYPRTLLKTAFICEVCGKTLTTSRTLTAHLRLHTAERPYACDMCTQKFTRLSHLKEHERIHTGEKPYDCGMCTQKFKELATLKNHELIHTGERPFACGMCTQKFRYLSHLKMHERIHTGERPYSCGMCTQKFRYLSNLRNHERIHTGEKPYACGKCTQKFKYRTTLKNHELIHTGEKPYACGMCTKKFRYLSTLKNHELIHTGEKPYVCGMCTQKFRQLSHLKLHERIHTRERPYSCGMCTQTFGYLSNLKNHERIHTGEKPYACGICTQKFKRRTTLKNHELIHTGEKPYACGMCTQKFKRRSTLKNHELIHTGEKPYLCGMCTRQFRRLANLKRHEQIHAGE